VVTLHDVTDSLRFEEDVQFRSALADNMAEAVILLKAADGEIVYVNETARRMFGYDRDELIGESIARLNAPTDQPPAERAAEILDSLDRKGAWSGEIEHTRKDGTRFWCSVTVSPVAHPRHGTVWISVHRDCTERRAADAALHSAELRLRYAFEDSPMATALVDEDFRVVDANAALCGITGFDREALVGRTLEDVAPPDGEHARQALARGIARHRTRARLITERGSVIGVLQTATAIRGPDDRLAGAVMIMDPSGED
jgi:PAS domain S-box-containing protein